MEDTRATEPLCIGIVATCSDSSVARCIGDALAAQGARAGTAGTVTTSATSSTGTGEVGDGTSVGTGISVGEECSGMSAEAEDAGAAECCSPVRWKAGTCATSSLSSAGCPRIGAGEVGEGTSVGTGISVGEEGTGAEALKCADSAEAGACWEARICGTTVGTSSISSKAAGDVGSGRSVGTGISVGEDGGPGGADPPSSADPGANGSGGSRPPDGGTAVGTSSGTSVGASLRWP